MVSRIPRVDPYICIQPSGSLSAKEIPTYSGLGIQILFIPSTLTLKKERNSLATHPRIEPIAVFSMSTLLYDEAAVLIHFNSFLQIFSEH